MHRLMRYLLAIVIAALVLPALPAYAQADPDPVGDWSGKLTPPGGEITLIVSIARDADGELSATVENPDQAPGIQVPVDEIAVAGGQLSWRIARIGATYEGEWNAETEEWQGKFNQGIELPLTLARGLPEARPVVEGLDGTWRATVEMNEATLRFVLNVATGERGTVVTLDSPDQMARNLPISNLTRDGDRVRFEYAPGSQYFEGTLGEGGETLEGLWHAQQGEPFAVAFARTSDAIERAERARPQTPEGPFPYSVEEVAFDNPAFAEVHLAGTLTLPEGEGPFPAAILISGSGAQDRDETIMGHKPFAVIADHLTRNGIAVLRYDDRGVAGSTGNYAAATSADLATDADAAAAYLATRADIDVEAIGFIGHSEGGMIGPIAMAHNDDIAFLVMLAGPGTGLEQLMLSQRRLVGAQAGLSQEQLDSSEPVMAAVFSAIADADSFEAGLAAARAVLTPDAMVAIGAAPDTDPQIVLAQLSSPWTRYFLQYDPAPNLARIDVPILALNGTLDLQVPAAENLPAIEAATSGNPDVTIVELEDLNHLFQKATTGGIGEYADIEETVSPEVLALMSDWLRERFVEP